MTAHPSSHRRPAGGDDPHGWVHPRRALLIGAVALALRLGFVLWAPGEPTGDGYYYGLYAEGIARGRGYLNPDGSPGIQWMPGWPAFLGALYALFGPAPRVGMIANAVLSAATAVLVGSLGARLFGRRGELAGLLYAVWPGIVYYTATLFVESLFNFLLVVTLHLLVSAARATPRRDFRFAAAGAGLGLCAMVKAEPLALGFSVLVFLWVVRRSRAGFLRTAAVTLGATVAVIAPWSVRNYLVFDRLVPTSANGGMVAYLGNHPGASGGQDLFANIRYARRHQRSTFAETNLATNAAGWRDAWRFARSHPREELEIVWRKLWLTYRGDHQGVLLVRGDARRPHLQPRVVNVLATIADVYWFALLALAAVGVATLRSWPIEARVLLPGLVVTWLCLHVVFLGNMRFHVPEALAYSLFAACGLGWLAGGWRRRSAPGAAQG